MRGLTLKQYAKEHFFQCLKEYKQALASKDTRALTLASVAIHVALVGVPKSYKRIVTKAYQQANTD